MLFIYLLFFSLSSIPFSLPDMLNADVVAIDNIDTLGCNLPILWGGGGEHRRLQANEQHLSGRCGG